MKNSTLRWIIALGVISMAGIISIQLFWLRSAYDLEDSRFNHNVNIALKSVSDSILHFNHSKAHDPNPVFRFSSNYYFVSINDKVDANLLEYYLQNSFSKRNINLDFEYGVYDCQGDRMIYGNYVNLGNQKYNVNPRKDLPKWKDKVYYFSVYFPHKESFVVSQLGIWIVSSILLFIIILFFAYTLFVILKQKRISEVQKDFINNMTHEFKTPLSTISLSSDVLKGKKISGSPEKINQYATIISEEAGRLKMLVERVLQAAITEERKIKLTKEKTDVHKLIFDLVQQYKMTIDQRGGSISYLPNAENYFIMADSLHLQNIIGNLLDNAIKYCRETPEIIIKTENTKKGICIEIEDKGIGIKKEFQKYIFDRFFRVPTGNIHDVKGFGLGLYYVKTIIKAHNGKVEFKSLQGVGSTFKIEIPF